ncbi:MAG: hypothetical protein O2782_06460 [bacterium]|nr:hypothetical protein [bacterium]
MSLLKMGNGGIFDAVRGGFFRYSTDAYWFAPHFEKMLYDNALLVPVYVDAWQVTAKPLFADVVRETLHYIVREMTSRNGGYCAAQDADTEGEEGKYFVWTPEQVEEVIDDEETARLFCAYYDITPQGNFEGSSILHTDADIVEQARLLGVTEPVLQAAVDDGRRRLFDARSWRTAPTRDDKILVAWNGMMISAMSRGYEAFGETVWLDSARTAAQFLVDHLIVEGGLRHSWKDGQAPVGAFQDDYAALLGGLVDLYEASFEPKWLSTAVMLADGMIERFWDAAGEGGFYYTEEGRHDLLVRTKNPYDGATPSGNSMAALALLRLAALTGQARFQQVAVGTLQAYSGLLENAPAACCLMACALSQYRSGPLELTFVGAPDDRQPLLRAAHRSYLPNRVVAGADTILPDEIAELLPLLAGRGPGADGGARAYVCRDASCSAPVQDVGVLTDLLQASVRSVGG